MRNGLEMSSHLLVAGRLKSTLSRFFCERIWDFYLVRSLSVVFECSGVEFFLKMNVEIWAEIAIFLPCIMACFCSENELG